MFTGKLQTGGGIDLRNKYVSRRNYDEEKIKKNILKEKYPYGL